MKKLTRMVECLETGVIGLLALGAAVLTVGEAVVRYFLPRMLPDWGAEVTIYLIGWALMLSCSRIIRDNMNINVEMLVDTLSPRRQRQLEAFSALLGVVISACIAYAGWLMVDFAHMLGERSDSSIRFPMYLYYLAIPVGFALSAVQYLFVLVRLARGEDTV